MVHLANQGVQNRETKTTELILLPQCDLCGQGAGMTHHQREHRQAFSVLIPLWLCLGVSGGVLGYEGVAVVDLQTVDTRQKLSKTCCSGFTIGLSESVLLGEGLKLSEPRQTLQSSCE